MREPSIVMLLPKIELTDFSILTGSNFNTLCRKIAKFHESKNEMGMQNKVKELID